VSRTRRKFPCHRGHKKPFRNWYRSPATLRTWKLEAAAVDALRQAGFHPRRRVVARGNGCVLPNAWDDNPIAAGEELPKTWGGTVDRKLKNKC
jgi:hypothetical protein